jgi:hypothetical protein
MAHSKFQPDHNGRRTPDSTITPALSVSHGLGAGKPYRHDTPNIARDSTAGKHVHAILPHGSSTAAQLAGAGSGGRGHATVFDGGTNRLPHAYGHGRPKIRDAAPLQELGRAIKREPT